jgi:hypothetical protein
MYSTGAAMRDHREAVSHREAIEAAVAAHNDADGELLLPPDAARLLNAMFPTGSLCQRSQKDLMQNEGFDRKTLQALLRALVGVGFLSKGPNRASPNCPMTYRLHLPPRAGS